MKSEKQDVLKEGLDINVATLNQALVDAYGDVLKRRYAAGDPIPDQISFSATSGGSYTGNAYGYSYHNK